jgi:hypothetical protein
MFDTGEVARPSLVPFQGFLLDDCQLRPDALLCNRPQLIGRAHVLCHVMDSPAMSLVHCLWRRDFDGQVLPDCAS